ncbi:MAG TPA: hypothetical protein PKA64_18855 [Myxococcota bacterium]|nr:hypothetical protein [Myxococcota bacterium]
MRNLSLTQPTVLLVALLVGCGPKTRDIDDPAMAETGAQMGEQSAEMATMEPEADDATIESSVQELGSTFQSMVSQHEAWSAASTARALPGAQPPPPPEGVSWDGSHLQVNWSIDTSGVALTYVVDLTVTSLTIDGTYDLDYTVGVMGIGTKYSVHAVYDGVTTDGVSCVTGGSITITYDLKVEAGGLGLPTGNVNEGGTIVVAYSGCNEVQLSGT